MKKNRWFYFYYGLALIVVIVNCFYLIKSNNIINIENVPEGEYQFNNFSPKKDIELKVYYIDLPVGQSVRVSATQDGETKNIFWQTGVQKVKIKWKNNKNVVINGIDLDFAEDEYFDSRSISSIFNDGLMGR